MGLLDDLYTDLQTKQVDVSKRKNNAEWVLDSFFTSRDRMSKAAQDWTYFSTADHKYVDSTWGGSFAVNARPQWTPLSDPRRIGTLLGRRSIFSPETNPLMDITKLGMGRMFSEQVDDEAQRVYFRFGVPQYNSLTRFLSNMTNGEAVQLATTGTSNYFSTLVTQVIAAGFMIPRAPIYTAFMIFTNISQRFFGAKIWEGGNAFYTLKSVQHQYWMSIQSMINEFLVATNVVTYESVATGVGNAAADLLIGASDSSKKAGYTVSPIPTPNNLADLTKMLPTLFDEKNGFNVMGVVNKTARRSMSYLNKLDKILVAGESSTVTYTEQVAKSIQSRAAGGSDITLVFEAGKVSDFDRAIDTITEAVCAASLWSIARECKMYSNKSSAVAVEPIVTGTEDDASKAQTVEAGFALDVTAQNSRDPRTADVDKENADRLVYAGEAIDKEGLKENLADYMDQALQLGAEFVAFDVAYTGAVQEGISNSVMPSPLGDLFNGVAGSARSFRHSVANGNIDDGIIGSTIQAAAGIAASALGNTFSFFTGGLGGRILDILQGVNIDIPSFWESSSVQLPTASYTIQLRSGGGDFFSQFKGIYLPLFCIMAGAFPQSVGGAAHVHPFYCQVFDKGRLQKSCAMITNITITRGAGNLAFNQRGVGLAIDVTIDVTDLAPMLAIPAAAGLLEPGDPLTQYIWTLASVDMDVYLGGLTRTKMAVQRFARRFGTLFSVANFSNYLAGGLKNSVLLYIVNPSLAWNLINEGDTQGIQTVRNSPP